MKFDSFKDQVIMITGAASGIGLATAIRFAEEEANVVLVDYNLEALDLATKKVQEASNGGRILSLSGDIRIGTQVKEIVANTLSQFNKIDVLVNNAGLYRGNSVQDTDDQEWNEIIDTNLKAPFLFCREIVPGMIASNSGAIINISSIGGVVSLEGSPAYVAAKTGLIGFTRALGLDLAPHGIRVNGIAPGWTRTPMTKPLYDDANVSTALLSDIPASRFAEAVEQANMVLLLASEQSSYMFGQTIVNDGGWSLR